MKRPFCKGILAVIYAWMMFACSATDPADIVSLMNDFRNPPEQARPMVWWHWMDGNITKDGIRKDLEWMKRSGIRGFHLFDASLYTPQVVRDRLVYMTPQWQEAFRYALHLADSLDLEVGIASSPGWSHTGGPWVKPEDAMKKLVWREMDIVGGSMIHIALPSPWATPGPYQNAVPSNMTEKERSVEGHYEDVAILAVRTDQKPLVPEHLWSSSGMTSMDFLTDKDLQTGVSLAPDGDWAWAEYVFDNPVTIRSAIIGDKGGRGETRLLADGKEVLSLPASTVTHASCVPQVTVSFPPVEAKCFRLEMKARSGGILAAYMGNPSSVSDVELTEFRLETSTMVNHAEAKAGFCTDLALPQTPQSDTSFPCEVIDLSRYVSNGKLSWDAPEGNWKIYRFGWSLTGRMNTPAPDEATGLEVDKLDPEAWRRYLTNYLDKYKEVLGGSLEGIDYLLTDSYEAGCATWTPRMLLEFKSRRGYDLMPWLPVLTGEILHSVPESEQFLNDWRKTLSELAAERFDEMTGLLLEYGLKGRYSESHETGRALVADGMDLKRSAAVPMAAVWTPGPIMGAPTSASIADMRESASVAHIYGQTCVAAESMTAVGLMGYAYSYYPGNLKPVADLEFASGVNRIIVHESAHQPLDSLFPGVSLSITGQWFNRHETWAEQARCWTDYLARNSFLLQQGRNAADFLVYYGDDTNVTARYADGEIGIPEGYNFDFVNPYALLNVITYSKGRFRAPSGCSWPVLLLDADSISAPVQKRLDAWKAQGAKICTLKGMDTFGIAPDIETTAEIRFVHRGIDIGELYWVSKPSDTFETVDLSFRISGKVPSVWDAETGNIYAVDYKDNGSRISIMLPLQPSDAKFVLFTDPSVAAFLLNGNVGIPGIPSVTLSGSEESVSFDGPWNVTFQPGRGAPGSALFPELISYTASKDAGIKYFSGTAEYLKEFDLSYVPGQVILDLGNVQNIAEVSVNGQMVRTLWKVPYMADITDYVNVGNNLLEVRVTNLWPNRLIRDAMLPKEQRLTYTTYPFYKADDTLKDGGLIGPVRLLFK